MAEDGRIKSGRTAYAEMNWAEAYAQLSSVQRGSELESADLKRLGDAAYLIANESEAVKFWTKAHNAYVDKSNVAGSARVGFLVSLVCLLKGEVSQSNGWLARIRRLLETTSGCRSERELVRLLEAIRQLFGGNPSGAIADFEAAVSVGNEVGDPDLLALALLCRGQALVAIGQVTEGVASLDEAMVSATGGQVSPILCGIIYCAVILSCQSVFDSERAKEWTATFDRWCASQPDLVPYRGQCLIHRSEIFQMSGKWPEAMVAADLACQWLADKSEEATGRAHYQKGELHRLLGEDDAADDCYDRAVLQGVDPQPGRALLRLYSGQTDAAVSAILGACGAVEASNSTLGNPERMKLLGPTVEICLAVGKTETAMAAAKELSDWASAFDAPLLRATSSQATGAVLASIGELEAALRQLSDALTLWQSLSMPYEVARVRSRLSELHRALGHADLAELHRAAAGHTFNALGAAHDLTEFAGPQSARQKGLPAGLTRRHVDVLGHLAKGLTNRQIAAELGISEHTVARHISNIFDKIGVSSRSAAVAFAHQSGLIR